MKRNGVKVTTPEFWFSWCLRIVWELNVDNIVILKLCRWATCGNRVLLIRCLEVVVFEPYIVLLFSHLTDLKCFLLVCPI